MAGGGDGIVGRWPHIRRYLRVDETGWVEHDMHCWHVAAKRLGLPCAKVAAACEEWADFFEWRLAQRAEELAGDRLTRHLVAEWTAEMAYCSRRCAAFARGEDPGEPVPLRVRRPDLYAEGQAVVDEIMAGVDARRGPAGAATA